MQRIKSSFHAIKGASERILIVCLMSSVLLTSAISWSKLISNSDRGNSYSSTNKTTQEVKNKIVLFSGLMLVVAEYFHTEE